MLLAIDIGNTNVTTGLFRGGVLRSTRRAVTVARATPDEVEVVLEGLLRLDDASFADIAAIAMASVVPSLTDAIEAIAERRDRPLTIATAGSVPLPVRVDRPAEVGADRLVNALAAARLYGTPAVVVDFGTATTFDAISADGEYLGGAIVPGIEISMDALFARAAWLRRVELVEPRNVIGRSTVESIEAGVVYGTVALVDGMVRRFEDELGKSTVIATGGLGGLIAPLSDTIQHHEPWLTLHGLRLIYEKNTA
jgi:type III pantothenate kinase